MSLEFVPRGGPRFYVTEALRPRAVPSQSASRGELGLRVLPGSTPNENGGTYRRLSEHVVLGLGFKVSGASFPIPQGHSRSRSTPRPRLLRSPKTGGKAAARLAFMRRLPGLVGSFFKFKGQVWGRPSAVSFYLLLGPGNLTFLPSI